MHTRNASNTMERLPPVVVVALVMVYEVVCGSFLAHHHDFKKLIGKSAMLQVLPGSFLMLCGVVCLCLAAGVKTFA